MARTVRAQDDSARPRFLAFELPESNEAEMPASEKGETIMKLRTSIAAIGAAAIVGSGAFALPALASTHPAAAPVKHTLSCISETRNMVNFTKTSTAIQDTDYSKVGKGAKVVGFDEVYGVALAGAESAADVSVVTKGGIMYGTFDINFQTGVITHGKISGGTGAFKNAKGTFTGVSINNNDTGVKITYTT
jgi:hypothetical protein